MTKEDALRAMLLLSALESWAFSMNKQLPDHLFEELQSLQEALRQEVKK